MQCISVKKIISIQKHNLILKSGNKCIPVTTLYIWYFQPGDSKTPYWILRIVTEQKEADFLEVKKDTRRVDEIRAMKEAWETAEPGRAVKVISECYLCSDVSSQVPEVVMVEQLPEQKPAFLGLSSSPLCKTGNFIV